MAQPSQPDRRVNLALEGGGVLGIAEVGAVAALREAGYSFANVAGTSAGSIVAAMVAAGMDDATLKKTLSSVDYSKFQKPVSFLGRVPVVGSVILWGAWAITKTGRYQQSYLTELLDRNLTALGCRTWGDLEAKIRRGRAVPLKIVTFTPNSGDKVVLPDDYPGRFGLEAADKPISFAVDASCAIPTFFESPEIVDSQGQRWNLTDGGATDSYPYDVAHWMDPSRRTIGVCIDWPKRYTGLGRWFRGPKLLLAELFSAGDASMQRLRERPQVLKNTIVVPTLGIDSQNFNITPEQVQALYRSGYEAARQWIARDLAGRASGGRSLPDPDAGLGGRAA